MHVFTRGPAGVMLQAAMPKHRGGLRPFSVNGLALKGVVVQTYVYDSTSGSFVIDPDIRPDQPRSIGAADPTTQKQNEINSIYCQVLCYGGPFKGMLPRVLVTQDAGGIHEGEIYRPRATRLDITENPLNVETKTNPADMDGDHVVIAFLEDDVNQPYIQRYIPHPNRDKGNDAKPIGQRMRLKEADGEPRIWKHRGACWGVDTNGNFLLDLTEAHIGAYQKDGTEPAPAQTGISGNAIFRVQKGATLKLVGPNDEVIEVLADGTIRILSPVQDSSLELQPNGNVVFIVGDKTELFDVQSGTVKLGDGAVQAAVLGDLWSSLHATYDTNLNLVFASIIAALTAINVKLVPASPTEVTGAITAVGTAQGVFTGSAAALASGPLSASVKVKT